MRMLQLKWPSRLIMSLLTLVLAGAFAGQASANLVQGTLIGVYSGNDSETELSIILGVPLGLVDELAKIELPATSSDGLSIFNLVLNEDDEAISGDWTYSGPGTVGFFVVKAGNAWALYEYTDAITGNMPNVGIWDTSDLDNKGVSHVTGYQVTPEPSTAMLIAAGLAAIGARRRRVGALS